MSVSPSARKNPRNLCKLIYTDFLSPGRIRRYDIRAGMQKITISGYMLATPLASTAIVRPPAANAPAMRGGVDSRARPLTIVNPARARLPANRFRLSSARTGWRAWCRPCPRPGRLAVDAAADKEHAGRIVDLSKGTRIVGVRLGEDVDAFLPAEVDDR